MKITGKTTVYGIIGWPVAHSLSPLFQNAFLRRAGLDGVYAPFPVPPERLADALDGLWAAGVAGLNVTVPHKESLPDVVRCDAAARIIGAVNTLRRGENGWEATNMDWIGVRDALSLRAGDLAASLARERVLLFGAGGTARAVLHALAAMGAREVLIANRSEDRAARLIADGAEAWPGLQLSSVRWDAAAVAEAAASARLLIHTTSIGLKDADRFPFELPACDGGWAMDAVYRPDGRTAFLAAAGVFDGRRDGMDGLPMLVAQGAASFAWWHGGKQPDTRAALTELEAQLGRARLLPADAREAA